jgi:hypothetical protein
VIAHAAEQRFEICPAATGTGTSRKLASLRLGVMAAQGNRSELSVVSVAEFEVEERRGDIIVKAAGFLAVYFKPPAANQGRTRPPPHHRLEPGRPARIAVQKADRMFAPRGEGADRWQQGEK